VPQLFNNSTAFGKPGIEPRWTSARKDGIGTAYSVASRVWFTLWQGIVTEIYYPTVDRPQIRDWQILVSDGETFFHEEKRDMQTRTEYVQEDALAFRVIHEHPMGYKIEKTVISDPHTPCVIQHIKVTAPPELRKKLKFYSLCSPHCQGGGKDNDAHAAEVNGKRILVAHKKNTWLAMGASVDFTKTSCGYVGFSDGWTDLEDNFVMDWEFECATAGNVAIMGEFTLPESGEFTLALGFGHGLNNAVTALLQTLSFPFEQQLERFCVQWQRASKLNDELCKQSTDNGFLLRASHKIMLAHEDKLNPGAFIASLSVPWGQAKGDEDLGGYHLVWPRDMVNTTTGLLAAGRDDTPLRALTFFACNQLPDGRFPQNFWISGEPYWSGVQLDEVAFPIMLAWRMKSHNRLRGFDPYNMAMKAASFLILNGPITQQDRWEEVAGFSPSTLAANIAALICASSFARSRNDDATAEFLQDYADYLRCHLEEWTVTTCGDLHPDIAEHFVRVNPMLDVRDQTSPNDAQVFIANRAPNLQSNFPARNLVDAGFLELVRYGILSPHDPLIKQSVQVVDHVLKVDTPFGPCWRRYNHDGYGNGEQGQPFTGVGVGRAWPLLTGERGHYELAAGNDVKPYIQAMERFATCGGTLPEQVWDTTDIPDARLFLGKPTGSAMPLVWAHSEYVKLLRSASDGKVFDLIPEVAQRYQNSTCKLIEMWHHGWQIPEVRPNFVLRIVAPEPFVLTFTFDGWSSNSVQQSSCTGIDVHFADVQIPPSQSAPLEFTFFWKKRDAWEGKNYHVGIKAAVHFSRTSRA
jgi:glucoamylase